MRRLLLAGWGAIGDTIHAIPAIIALRRVLAPGDEIWFDSFLARRVGVIPHRTTAADLLKPLGLVDRVRHHVVHSGALGIAEIEARMFAAVVSGRFDRVLVLMPFASTPKLLALLDRWTSLGCLAAGPGTGLPLSVDRPLCWHLLESLRHRGIADVRGDDSASPFLELPSPAVAEASHWLAHHRRDTSRRLLAIAPEASYPSNRWPTERFKTLLEAIDAQGDFEVVLCGGGSSVGLCRDIAAQSPRTLLSAGQLTVLGTAALFSKCAALVGLDTGTSHLASACGTPVVAIYGQRGFGRWYFPPGRNAVVLQRDVPCRGCWLSVCDRPGHPCITGIGVEEVLAAVQRVTR